MRHGVYVVTGQREYRGHPTGSRFTARLDPRAEQRAIQRGDIQLVVYADPEPGPYTFPTGWLPQPPDTTTEAPKGASTN